MAKLSAAFVLAFGLIASAASAQSPSDQQIVVLGQRQTEDAVRAFVHQMAIAPRNVNQLGRWDRTRTICPGVAGLQSRYAQFVIDRMAQRAEAVDLDVGAPGCRSNILIVITPDADAIAHELVDGHEGRMGVLYEPGRTTLGRSALAAFVNSDAPVRWWHVNNTSTRDGEPIHVVATTPERPFPVVNLTGGLTRISRTTRQDFVTAFIIVDARQLQGVSFEALADYVAMAALAQLNPDADTSSYPTILNLFSARAHGQAAPNAMTEWDVAYLHGLYAATQEARNAQQQESEIAHSMTRGVER